MISPILKWNHTESHFVPYFDSYTQYARRELAINLSDNNFEFLRGHIIGDRVIFPAAGWIYYIWETFSMMSGVAMEKLSVVFDDVRFQRATTLMPHHDAKFTIEILKGKFTIFRNN